MSFQHDLILKMSLPLSYHEAFLSQKDVLIMIRFTHGPKMVYFRQKRAKIGFAIWKGLVIKEISVSLI